MSSLRSGPTLENVRGFWDNHINNEYYSRKDRGSAEYFDEIERRRYTWHYHLRDLFQELRGGSGRLLEVGCGMGIDSVQLARCGFDVTAVDLSRSAIDLAIRYADMRGVSVEFREGNAERLEFEDGSFDTVYSFGVLHHTPRIEEGIAEVHRVLRVGGMAYVMLYHRNSIVDLVHRAFRLPYESPKDLKDHCPVVYRFTKGEAAQLFGQFTKAEIETAYPFTYGFRRLVAPIPESMRRMLGRKIGWHLMIRATR